jgi:polyphenol oxidase
VSDAFDLEEADGILVVRCRLLAEVPGVAHAFSTARGDGVAGFDLGAAKSADPLVLARRVRFLAAAGFAGRSAAVVHQVHGTGMVRARDTASIPDADGVAWFRRDSPERVPAVRTADCVPILLVDRRGRAAAAVHAGWRGTAGRIAAKAVEGLAAQGIAPGDLLAALGPAILSCCYEVGLEVAEALAASLPAAHAGEVSRADGRGGARADLHAANRLQLVASGVPRGAIREAPWCTCCRADLFHSYRRQGPAAGRMMACVGPARTQGREAILDVGAPVRHNPRLRPG